MFETRPTLELVQIAQAGGGFELDARMRSTLDLVQIATAASRGGGTIVLKGLVLRSTLELVQIAQAGRGRVIFAD